jgi:hypothetical protein
MSIRFLAAAIFIGIFPSLSAEVFFDLECDRQIIECLNTPEFSNSVIDYRISKLEVYSIRIIHNPKEEMLWGGYLYVPICAEFVTISNLPRSLNHLVKDLILTSGNPANSHIDLREISDTSLSEAYDIHPVFISEQIAEPICDTFAKNTFSSSKFSKQLLYYHLDGKYYQVCILHNPERLSFSSTTNFGNYPGTFLSTFGIYWNKKYAIMVDEKAPQQLIDHLFNLANPSYWDHFFNFSIENGTWAEYEHQGRVYPLAPWYYYGAKFSEKHAYF